MRSRLQQALNTWTGVEGFGIFDPLTWWKKRRDQRESTSRGGDGDGEFWQNPSQHTASLIRDRLLIELGSNRQLKQTAFRVEVAVYV